MKQVVLNKLTLRNFKGVANEVFEFNGQDSLVLGNNGTGKTTIADAFYWLIVNCNYSLNNKFEVFPRNKESNEIHGVSVEVEGDFTIDEQTVRFKRVLIEDVPKENKVVDSDICPKKSYYFIDNAPYDMKSYYKKVEELITDKNNILLLSNPLAFFNLSEEEQRNLLLDMAKKNDSELPLSDEVRRICGVNSLEVTRNALKKMLSENKKELTSTVEKIHVYEELCDIYKDYDKAIEALKTQEETLRQEIATIKNKYQEQLNPTVFESRGEPSMQRIVSLKNEIERVTKLIVQKQNELTNTEKLAQNMTCPSCGYKLANYDKALEEIKAYISELEHSQEEYKEELQKATNQYQEALKIYELYEIEQEKKKLEVDKIQRQFNIELSEKDEQIANIRCAIQKESDNKAFKERVVCLQERRKVLDDTIASAMTDLQTLNKHTQSILEKINLMFDGFSFVLYEQQANGDTKMCCKAKINGVSFANANTASRIKAGLQIIKVLNEYFGVAVPVFVDNKESIVELPQSMGQRICLKVDESYDCIHIEEEPQCQYS